MPILGIAIAAAINKSHPGWVSPFIGLTAVFATLAMIAANASLNLVDGVWQLGGLVLKRSQTMFAGFLILAAGLLLLLFALGAAMEGRGDDEEDLYAGKRSGSAAAGQRGGQQVTYGRCHRRSAPAHRRSHPLECVQKEKKNKRRKLRR